jgi:hypothetical protein
MAQQPPHCDWKKDEPAHQFLKEFVEGIQELQEVHRRPRICWSAGSFVQEAVQALHDFL